MINDGPMMMPIMPGTPQHNDNESVGLSSNENNQQLMSDPDRKKEMKKHGSGPQDFKKAYLKVRLRQSKNLVVVYFCANQSLLLVQLVQDMAQKEGHIAVSDIELRELNNQVSIEYNRILFITTILVVKQTFNCFSLIEAIVEPFYCSCTIRQICSLRARACSSN